MILITILLHGEVFLQRIKNKKVIYSWDLEGTLRKVLTKYV